MDSQRELTVGNQINPWLLSTNLQGAHVDVYEQSRLLWCKPHNLDEDDEDAEDAIEIMHEQMQVPEMEAEANLSSFQRMTSRATPTELSPSARTYQSTRLSAQEFCSPFMNIRSQTCELYSSRKRHQLPLGPSLSRWTPTANLVNCKAKSSSLESLEGARKPGLLKRLMGRNGTPPTRTNSESSGRAIVTRR
uniref:P4 n=1 Tax=Foeniculum vulgare polerovirus TaxID=2885085 RepID=A0AB39A5C9_9VIRU